MLTKANNQLISAWARAFALAARLDARLAIEGEARKGMDDAIWKILLVGAVAALGIFVLYPLYSKVLAMGTNAINRVGGAPW